MEAPKEDVSPVSSTSRPQRYLISEVLTEEYGLKVCKFLFLPKSYVYTKILVTLKLIPYNANILIFSYIFPSFGVSGS
jgi:hypothetical protein